MLYIGHQCLGVMFVLYTGDILSIYSKYALIVICGGYILKFVKVKTSVVIFLHMRKKR